jgi:hypothetical protein
LKIREAHIYPESETAITLTVHTKSPEKWLLVDRETGEVYQGSFHGDWDRLDPVIKPEKKKDAS